MKLAFRFVDICRNELELGDWDAVRRLLTKAEKAESDVTRFLATVVRKFAVLQSQVALKDLRWRCAKNHHLDIEFHTEGFVA